MLAPLIHRDSQGLILESVYCLTTLIARPNVAERKKEIKKENTFKFFSFFPLIINAKTL